MRNPTLLPVVLALIALAALVSGCDAFGSRTPCGSVFCPANGINGFTVEPADSVFVGDTVTVTARLSQPINSTMTAEWDVGLSRPLLAGGGEEDDFVVGVVPRTAIQSTRVRLIVEREGYQPSEKMITIPVYTRTND